eukprot:GHVS01074737.1.p1 GENE.GHVS01074737.1~~GHVS01074737.1.p1  ORF type:complete len:710 (+),score=174.17 GHVS01074737.1:2730-4859(+)
MEPPYQDFGQGELSTTTTETTSPQMGGGADLGMYCMKMLPPNLKLLSITRLPNMNTTTTKMPAAGLAAATSGGSAASPFASQPPILLPSSSCSQRFSLPSPRAGGAANPFSPPSPTFSGMPAVVRQQPSGHCPSLLNRPSPKPPPPTNSSRTPARRLRPQGRAIRGLGLLDSQPGFPSAFGSSFSNSPGGGDGSFGVPHSNGSSAASEASPSSDLRSPPAPTPRRPLRRQTSSCSTKSAEEEEDAKGGSPPPLSGWNMMGRLPSSPSTRFPSSPTARTPSSPAGTPPAFPLYNSSSHFSPSASVGSSPLASTHAIPRHPTHSGSAKQRVSTTRAPTRPFDKQRLQSAARGKASRGSLYSTSAQTRTAAISPAGTIARMRLSGAANSQSGPSIRSAFRRAASPGGGGRIIRDASRSRLHGYAAAKGSLSAAANSGVSSTRRFGGHNLRHSVTSGARGRRGPPTVPPLSVWLLQHPVSISVKCLATSVPYGRVYDIPSFADHQPDEEPSGDYSASSPDSNSTLLVAAEMVEALPEVVVRLEGRGGEGPPTGGQEEEMGGATCADGPCTPMSCTSTCSSPVPGCTGGGGESAGISPFATAISSIMHIQHSQSSAAIMPPLADEQQPHYYQPADADNISSSSSSISNDYVSSSNKHCLVKQLIRTMPASATMMEQARGEVQAPAEVPATHDNIMMSEMMSEMAADVAAAASYS